MSDTGVPVQTCYRHPDRRAGVRCQRCDRLICPSCMTEASVGFHCPDCVKKHGQRVRRGIPGVTTGEAYGTYAIVAANLAVFVWGIVLNQGDAVMDGSRRLTQDYALNGSWVASGQWYRLVTSGFLHHGVIHIGFNMYLIYMLGSQFERVMGRAQFLAVYFTALLGGSLGVMIAEPNAFTAGASGAGFGLFGLAIATQRAAGINPFQTQIGSIVMLNLFITFTLPNISIGGHLGGLAAGFLAGELIIRMTKQKVPYPVRVGAVSAIGLVCLVASLMIA